MNKTLWQYYVDTAADITDRALEHIRTLDQWKAERPRRREEFFASMGLPIPLPAVDLRPTEHGTFAGPGYQAVKLAYQILPDCWGTGNLYLPDPLPPERLPAVLCACGHCASGVADYQGHVLVWPRRGYAAFVFDTIQQTDNPGTHRGPVFGVRWDWISRGYTAAGGELLNSLRALDVLAGRPEVDPDRIGTTGRSGGGAHSFYVTVADDRIKAAVPIVGVPSLKSTIGNRIFWQHCDCMYALGLYERDNADFAALIAPRPVLFCYARSDGLYSRAEYQALVAKARAIYRLYDREDHCQLLEYPGQHGAAEPPIAPKQQWFDRHVAARPHPPVPLGPAERPEPEVSVFDGRRPVPDRLDLLPELLGGPASLPLPHGAADWPALRQDLVERLQTRVFHRLARRPEPLVVDPRGTWLSGTNTYRRYRGEIGGMETWFELTGRATGVRRLLLAVANQDEDIRDLHLRLGTDGPADGLAILEPRATGLNAPSAQPGRQALLRVGMLVGATPVLLWLEDLRQTIAYLRQLPACAGSQVYLYGRGDAAVACLYQAILDETIAGVLLDAPPESHTRGGYLTGILREMDITQAVGLVAPRPVGIVTPGHNEWYALRWGHRVYHRLGVPGRHALGPSLATLLREVLETKA